MNCAHWCMRIQAASRKRRRRPECCETASKGKHHGIPKTRPQRPEGVAAVPGRDDVRRRDGRDRCHAHHRQGLRAGRQLHRHRRRVSRRPLRRDRGARHRAPARQLGGGHQVRLSGHRHGGAERAGPVAQVDRAVGRGQPAAPENRLHRHPVLSPRAGRRAAGRGRARHRRPDPPGQAALLRRVQLPRLAHRRDRAHCRPARHRPAGGQRAALQHRRPHRRGRAAPRRRALRAGRGLLQPAGARRPPTAAPDGATSACSRPNGGRSR